MTQGAAVATQPARPRLDHVDGLRATAALIVFVNHAFAQVWHPQSPIQPSGALSGFRYFMVAGHLAVTVFIVISGFCLTLPVVHHGGIRGSFSDFMKARARRILPPYYAALLLCLLLIATVIGDLTGSLWDVPILQLKPTSVISHFLLMQDLFGTAAINYVFWSIAVEWHIYFLVPLLVWIWRKYGAARLVIGALVVGYGLRLAFGDTRLARANPHFLGMFALGMLAAYAARSVDPKFVKLRQGFPWWFTAVLGFAATAALIGIWDVNISTERFFILDLPIGVMAASLLVVSSRPEQSLLTRVFAWRPLVFVGTFSYSVYLIHAPLLQILWQYVMTPLGFTHAGMFAFLMTVGLALVIGLAYVFFLAFEAPFMRALPKKPAAQPTAVAAP